jgi:hypothetical protein
MTTLGFHYFPDDVHYRQADLQAWLPELLALDARWLTLTGSLTRAVPEAFVKGLLDAGIEPIIHIPAVPLRHDSAAVTASTLAVLFRTYARWGVKYVVPFSEPNSRPAWAQGEWGQASLVQRFLDVLLPLLENQISAGLLPVFPALKAGGDYWDTAFLEAALAGLAARGKDALARQLTFATNLWTFNRPIDWGAGGPERWPHARPYLTPPGSQDQRGFHIFDWYNHVIRRQLGVVRPLLCLAGGPRVGDHTDERYPAVSEVWHASCIQQVVQLSQSNQLPDNLLNVNFWLLTAADASPFAGQAMYRPDGGSMAAVKALKGIGPSGQQPQRRRINESKALQKDVGAARGSKQLRHYLLLPVFEWGVSDWHWRMALEYVRAHRPVCGFSPDEAQHAQLVTLLGNEQGISAQVEQRLRQAGCQVERILLAGEAGARTA